MFRLQVPYKTKPVLTSIIYFTYYFLLRLGIYSFGNGCDARQPKWMFKPFCPDVALY